MNLKINHTEQNLYDILEIPIYSQEHTIKKAFKKLALKYHPDKINKQSSEQTSGQTSGQTSEHFIKIKNAF